MSEASIFADRVARCWSAESATTYREDAFADTTPAQYRAPALSYDQNGDIT